MYQEVWQTLHSSVAIDAGQRALGLGQQFVAAEQSIFMVDPSSAGANRANHQPQRLAEPTGPMVSAGDLLHDQDNTVAFQVGIIVTHGLELLDAGQLEVLKVVGMVNEALRIGFVVPHANFDLVFLQHVRLAGWGLWTSFAP